MMTSVTQSNRVKIGIRPTIDGRRMGVRESLEEQTMQMAKSVAELLQNHIRHTDGSFVECVIADTCIGGVAEAAACAEKFKLNNVGLTITVTPCWCYGSETIDMDPHMPKAIWGFNGTERPGAVYLAAALAGHSQLGLPAFSIYDMMCKKRMTQAFHLMLKKNCYALRVPALQLRLFAANPTYLSVPFPWVSPVLSSTNNSSKNTSACVTNMWT